MNGRIYDPVLGRFISADPNVDGVSDAQGFNRYSYVGNNPMNATDPSGYFKLKDILPAIIAIVVTAVVIVTQQWHLMANPTFWGALKAGLGTSAAIIGGAAGGFAGGFSGSLLNGGSLGDAFKAGVIGAAVGAATAWASGQIGGFFDGLESGLGNWGGRTLAHATVGGLASEAQGGSFRHGFYSSAASAGIMHAKGVGSFMGGDKGGGWIAARTATAAAIGGTASVLGGGKFANGAVTSAFQHLFNSERSRAAIQKYKDENPNIFSLGNDAHRTLQSRARAIDPEGVFTERWSDGEGSWFGGRPDIGNRTLRELLEIKSANYAGYFEGRVQLEVYELFAPGYHAGRGSWLFGSSTTMTLSGKYATYHYTNMGDGVILYTYKLHPNVNLAPIAVPAAAPAGGVAGANAFRAIPAFGR